MLCATTSGPDETRALARGLSACVKDGDLLVLSGDLGAGKTCFSQGFGKGLGIEERITSPTFTLHNQYQGRLLFNHLDVYRLDDLEETLDLDLPEMLESGVTVIEWGDQIDPALPSDHLGVRILMVEVGGSDVVGPEEQTDSGDEVADDDRRLFQIEAGGPSWTERMVGIETAISQWVQSC